MSNERNPESPVTRELAPEHGPDFWSQLGIAMNDDTTVMDAPASAAAADATSEMPQLRSVHRRLDTAVIGADRLPEPSHGSRALWPMAAAAVALVVLGLGFLATRGASDPTTTTEVVSAPTDGAEAGASAGGGDESGEVDAAPSVDAAEDTGEATGVDTTGSSLADDANNTDGATGSDGSAADTATITTTPVPAPPIPDFASARGARGEPDHVPLDGGVAADGTFLANWPERNLTWFAVTDPATSCANAGHSEILYVNGSGITQQMRDPQLRFSGEISHFEVNSELSMGAWVVACGNQLEMYVATLEPTGRIDDLTLAWLGEGSTSTALVIWDGNEVSLNAIEPDGAAFAAAYDVETKVVSRNGGPSRIMVEAGAPAERSLTPIAASPDGGLSYFTGTAPPGTLSACSELFGSGRSDTLWLRQGEGQWLLAAGDDFPVGTVTAAALNSNELRIAFADVCPGESGRVIVGAQLADGRIGELEEVDLTPFAPGYVAQLFWADDTTLRIEIDNAEFGFGTVRFDYRVDENLIVQLD